MGFIIPPGLITDTTPLYGRMMVELLRAINERLNTFGTLATTVKSYSAGKIIINDPEMYVHTDYNTITDIYVLVKSGLAEGAFFVSDGQWIVDEPNSELYVNLGNSTVKSYLSGKLLAGDEIVLTTQLPFFASKNHVLLDEDDMVDHTTYWETPNLPTNLIVKSTSAREIIYGWDSKNSYSLFDYSTYPYSTISLSKINYFAGFNPETDLTPNSYFYDVPNGKIYSTSKLTKITISLTSSIVDFSTLGDGQNLFPELDALDGFHQCNLNVARRAVEYLSGVSLDVLDIIQDDLGGGITYEDFDIVDTPWTAYVSGKFSPFRAHYHSKYGEFSLDSNVTLEEGFGPFYGVFSVSGFSPSSTIIKSSTEILAISGLSIMLKGGTEVNKPVLAYYDMLLYYKISISGGVPEANVSFNQQFLDDVTEFGWSAFLANSSTDIYYDLKNGYVCTKGEPILTDLTVTYDYAYEFDPYSLENRRLKEAGFVEVVVGPNSIFRPIKEITQYTIEVGGFNFYAPNLPSAGDTATIKSSEYMKKTLMFNGGETEVLAVDGSKLLILNTPGIPTPLPVLCGTNWHYDGELTAVEDIVELLELVVECKEFVTRFELTSISENYDIIGRWEERDPTGELYPGSPQYFTTDLGDVNNTFINDNLLHESSDLINNLYGFSPFSFITTGVGVGVDGLKNILGGSPLIDVFSGAQHKFLNSSLYKVISNATPSVNVEIMIEGVYWSGPTDTEGGYNFNTMKYGTDPLEDVWEEATGSHSFAEMTEYNFNGGFKARLHTVSTIQDATGYINMCIGFLADSENWILPAVTEPEWTKTISPSFPEHEKWTYHKRCGGAQYSYILFSKSYSYT